MKLIRLFSAVVLVTLMLSVPLTHAASVPTISYQGTLTNSDGTPFNGVKEMTFKMYDAAGTNFWTELQSNMVITNGRFATVFGLITPLNVDKLTGDISLGITVTGDVGEMTPRQLLTNVPFAFNGVPKGGIIMWSGATNAIPAGWALCDGNNGTPPLQDRFVIGASSTYAAGTSGGNKDHFHKGSDDGGDLRAMIGATNSDATTIGYRAANPVNPNTNANPWYANIGIGVPTTSFWYTAGLGNTGHGFTHFTPVQGYTSEGFSGVKGGVTTAGSLPPYYALAYIMKL